MLVAVAAVTLALAGCASAPDHGVIHAKQHTDAYYYTTMICGSYGKYGCTVWIPMTNYMPVGSEYSVPRQ
jgi:uncharacterized protein YceK